MTGEFPSVLHRLWNNASTGTLERLDPAECIARYATSIQSAQRNVLLVASDDQVLPPNENPLINGSHAYGRWKFSAMSAMARDTARNSFDWICSGMDTKRPCSLGIDAIRDSSAESWLMGPGAGWPVKYCLSERADPTCKLHFEPTIGTIVTILNFVKAGVMFYVAFLVRDEPLMTMGDAVASFLERPDPTSKNRPGDNDPYNSRFFGYQTVGFSPPAIIAVLVCGGLMTISIVVLGHIPYRRGMPVAGSSSMAISAACHLTTAEDEANEGTASSEKLQWGVVARADNGPGHCAFSPRLVEAPVKGRVYAGSFNPGL
ncbi:unnamed protein product [Alternaria alternata]